MGSKKRPKPRNGKPSASHKTTTASVPSLGRRTWFALFTIAIIAACLFWQLRREPPGRDGEPSGNESRKSVFAGIAESHPAFSSQATAEDQREAATTAIDDLLTQFPNSKAALAVAALLHTRLGETEEAAKLWRDCLKLDPEFTDAHYHLGKFARDRGDYPEAAEMLGKVVSSGQAAPVVVAMLGDSLLQAGRAADAIAVLEDHATQSQVSSKGLLTLGQAYLHVKQYENAKETFLMLTDADPSQTRAYYGLATAYARLGDRDKARENSEEFRRLAKIDYEKQAGEVRESSDRLFLPDILAQTLMACGHIYAEAGKVREAENAWLEVAVLAPTNLQCRHELLYLFETDERLEDAIEISRQICELEPQNPDHWLNLGLLNVRLERVGPAQEAIERAMQIAPDNPKVRQAYDLVREGM